MPVSGGEVKRVEVSFPADGTRWRARASSDRSDLDLAVLLTGSDLPFCLSATGRARPRPARTGGRFPPAVRRGDAVRPTPCAAHGKPGRSAPARGGMRRALHQTDAPCIRAAAAVPCWTKGNSIGSSACASRAARVGPGSPPINRVKDCLEATAWSVSSPHPPSPRPRIVRLEAAPLPAPDTFDDPSPSRLSVEGAPPQRCPESPARGHPARVASGASLRARHDSRAWAGLRGGEPARPAGRAAGPRRRRPGRVAVRARPRRSVRDPPTSEGEGRGRGRGAPSHISFNRSVLDGWLPAERTRCSRRRSRLPAAPPSACRGSAA